MTASLYGHEPAGATLNGDIDTIDYAYDPSGRQTRQLRGATVLSERSVGPDGTISWRKDGDADAIGQSTFGYDWAKRLVTVDLPDSGFSTAVPTFGWRLDGLIASRTWSGSAATFSYDRAKRVTGLTKGALTETQTYDKAGNVTSEARSFSGIAGDAGANTQSFTYDALNRVTGSSGLASGSRSYTYDRDSDRLTKTEGGITFSSTYDRTDELVSVIKTGGTTQTFGYDAYGNLTGDAETATAVTAMTYDLDDHLTAIDAAGTANDATFTLDALGRFRTRVTASGTDTYSYLATSETVVRIATSGGTTTDSVVSPAGDRLGVKVGATLNWFLPDLHGDIAASLDATEATVVNATRYDAYGQTIITGTAGGTRVGYDSWKYQGRLDLSPAGLATPLYDMSARFYDPGLGAFTQLDSIMGSAQDPLSLNRFLYAAANPWTLTDPTGHCATTDSSGGFDLLGTIGNCIAATAGFGWGIGETGTDLVGETLGLAGQAKDASLCAANPHCWGDATDTARQTVGSVERGARDFAAHPEERIREGVSKAALASGDWIGRQHEALTSKGGFEGGRTAAHIFAGVMIGGLSVVTGAGAARAGLRGASELAGGLRAGRLSENLSASLRSVSNAYDELETHYSWRDVRARSGPAPARLNTAFPKGIEYKELTHAFLPRRAPIPNFVKNSAWNLREQWGSTHALSDPSRYRFMPLWWKAANPLPSMPRRTWARLWSDP